MIFNKAKTFTAALMLPVVLFLSFMLESFHTIEHRYRLEIKSLDGDDIEIRYIAPDGQARIWQDFETVKTDAQSGDVQARHLMCRLMRDDHMSSSIYNYPVRYLSYAVEWCGTIALNEGDDRLLEMLADVYVTGEGDIKPDPLISYFWRSLSVTSVSEMKKSREEILLQVSPEMLEVTDKRIAKWRHAFCKKNEKDFRCRISN